MKLSQKLANFSKGDADLLRKAMGKKIFELFIKIEKPLLGRWNLKSCNEISTSINSIYQNRDHCGDTICKTPKKAVEYVKVDCPPNPKK